MMRISVIMPCYNAGPWVGEALRSAADQTYKPHEIVVIEDGSTDDSLEQIKASGVDVKLLQTNRANGAGARNAGIEAATGDWIAFLDADDVWYPHHLERAVALLKNSGDVGFMSRFDRIMEDGSIRPLPYSSPLDTPMSGLHHLDYIKRFQFHGSIIFGHSTIVVRRDRVIEVGLFDVTQVCRHDFELWMRVIRDQTWSYSPGACMAYRTNTPNSLSSDLAGREFYYFRGILKNVEGYDIPEMFVVVRHAAWKAMVAAYTDGESTDQRRIRGSAWRYLTACGRLTMTLAISWPGAFRRLNKFRRKVVMGRNRRRNTAN